MGSELNYSFLDRLLHRVAFSGPFVQLTAADVERTLFRSSYEPVKAARPIFITSLPRAGTTVMLEALQRFPTLASHTYRDMPFVMAPMLWSQMSGGFRMAGELHERAHADGIAIGYDSPEAFEEILWRTFWPAKYSNDRIALWNPKDANREARAFFADHIRKIVALRRPDRAADGRYVSKNNANIARLPFIHHLFPDATILVPVRGPLAHARSLLRQHQNFLKLHAESPFVRRYMADIGHYEFGALHRPIAFPALEAWTAGRDPLTLDYWIGYWIAAFEHVLAHRDKAVIVSYEEACANPERALRSICERLELADEDLVPSIASAFRAEPAAKPAEPDVDRRLLDQADQLHQALFDGKR